MCIRPGAPDTVMGGRGSCWGVAGPSGLRQERQYTKTGLSSTWLGSDCGRGSLNQGGSVGPGFRGVDWIQT